MNKFFYMLSRFRDFVAKKEVGWNASQIETQVWIYYIRKCFLVLFPVKNMSRSKTSEKVERTLYNSCPERIKLKMHWGCGPRPLFAGLIQRRWTPWSKPKHGFDNYHNKDNSLHHFRTNNFQIIRQQLTDYSMLCRHILKRCCH